MQEDEPPVKVWLATLEIESLTQWDVLIFLYRHQISLVGAEFIARLLGYTSENVVAALEFLEPRGLVQRSRVAQNVRLYQFTVPVKPPRREAFEKLAALARSRAGRLLLFQNLAPRDRTPQAALAASKQFVRDARRNLRIINQRQESRKKPNPTDGEYGKETKSWRKLS